MAWKLRLLRSKPRRHNGAQRERRQCERSIRRAAVSFTRWTYLHHLTTPQAAALLGLRPRTLASWMTAWRQRHLAAELRGRPLDRPDPSTRNLLIALFQLLGPGVSVHTLQDFLPQLARRQVEDLARRYRRLWRKKIAALIFVLRWNRPGSVWAADFTCPPTPVDGHYHKILAVRDLASGKLLAALPVEQESAEHVVSLLLSLFLAHGAPLALKSDNGAPFTADITGTFLDQWQVAHLLSPARLPAYNGAAEAGIGALKTRAHLEAARYGRPGEWTCDDVEAARLQANETSRPHGHDGPTPDDLWNARRPISPEERRAFLDTLAHTRDEARKETGLLPGIDPAPRARQAIERIAIARALPAHELLSFKRRRIPPLISPARSADIS